MPLLPEPLLVDLEAVAEQDEDQSDDGQTLHELGLGLEVERAEPRVPKQEAGDDEARGQRQEAALGKARYQGAENQQRAECRERRVQKPDAGGDDEGVLLLFGGRCVRHVRQDLRLIREVRRAVA
jgi:hypothetical protein